MTALRTRRILLTDMIVQGRIGVHQHEQGQAQRVRVSIELLVEETGAGPEHDDIGEVVDYDHLVLMVRDMVGSGHIQLVETLAERLARASLYDPRILTARVRVEKLDVFEDVAAIGVEIERHRGDLSTSPD